MLELQPWQKLHCVRPLDYLLWNPLCLQLIVTNEATDVVAYGDNTNTHPTQVCQRFLKVTQGDN